MKLSRRTLLVGTGAAAGLAVAWSLWPRAYAPGLSAHDGQHVFGHFLKVGPDGRVTVAVPQVEGRALAEHHPARARGLRLVEPVEEVLHLRASLGTRPSR